MLGNTTKLLGKKLEDLGGPGLSIYLALFKVSSLGGYKKYQLLELSLHSYKLHYFHLSFSLLSSHVTKLRRYSKTTELTKTSRCDKKLSLTTSSVYSKYPY